MEEIKSKITTQFKILERSERVQKYLREIKTVKCKSMLVISKYR